VFGKSRDDKNSVIRVGLFTRQGAGKNGLCNGNCFNKKVDVKLDFSFLWQRRFLPTMVQYERHGRCDAHDKIAIVDRACALEIMGYV
jgi:hypothetical protein